MREWQRRGRSETPNGVVEAAQGLSGETGWKAGLHSAGLLSVLFPMAVLESSILSDLEPSNTHKAQGGQMAPHSFPSAWHPPPEASVNTRPAPFVHFSFLFFKNEIVPGQRVSVYER